MTAEYAVVLRRRGAENLDLGDFTEQGPAVAAIRAALEASPAGASELDVGVIFGPDDATAGFGFDPALARLAAERGVTLRVSFYPVGEFN